jgi:hypothetical protein
MISFIVSSVIALTTVLIGFAVGYITSHLLFRLPASIPSVDNNKKTTAIFEWTRQFVNVVKEIIENEPNDYARLIKNLDYKTRPLRLINIFNDRYVVVIGKNGNGLVHVNDYYDIIKLRKKKIKQCTSCLPDEHPFKDCDSVDHFSEGLKFSSTYPENDAACKTRMRQALTTNNLPIPASYT